MNGVMKRECIGIRALGLALCVLLWGRAVLPAEQPTWITDEDSEATYADLDDFLEGHLKRLNLPGAVLAVVEGEEIVHRRGFDTGNAGGMQAKSALLTQDTPFFIGSLTKSFTAVAIMQLVEEGRVDLNAPVQRYLPWFRVADSEASAQITVRHLLNQTSGLPQLVGMRPLADFDPSPRATERQARELTDLVLSRSVGGGFEYSNMNYNLLGLVVEAVTGESYAEYLRHRIFQPLGMSRSFAWSAAARANGPAVGHRLWFGLPVSAPDLPVPTGSLPSGQLISSSEDMARYLVAHLNGGRAGGAQILSAEGMAELHRPAARAGAMGVDMGSYAMGWFVQEREHGTVVSHHGTVPNFFAFMALLPEQQRGMVVLVNGNHLFWDVALQEVCMEATSFLAGGRPESNSSSGIFWGVRAALLIPLLQLLGILVTVRRIRLWRRNPQRRPTGAKGWILHLVLPALPNLALAACAAALIVMRLVRFMELFLPDLTWLIMVCGSAALLWLIVRTWLMLSIGGAPNPRPRSAARTRYGIAIGG